MNEAWTSSLHQLGRLFGALSSKSNYSGYDLGVTEEEYQTWIDVIETVRIHNGWFTPDNVRFALKSWCEVLSESALQSWIAKYQSTQNPKTIALVMAGNIPLVGFHDLLCVVLSGHKAMVKLSSEDNQLLPKILETLTSWNPKWREVVTTTKGKLAGFDAIIATGSNNSLQHFNQYFGKYPHLFRHNRTSVAVLDGDESEAELKSLGDDIFTYFGLGCRNVSHVLLPQNFDIDLLFKGLFHHKEAIYNKKYGNNYDYNKAVYLMNKIPLLDNNFILLRETEDLHSPLAMLHFHRYSKPEEVESYLKQHEPEIQVVIGHGYAPFGSSQSPALDDYADGIDTMDWLVSLGQ